MVTRALRLCIPAVVWLLVMATPRAQIVSPVPLLPESVVAALANELSGENAKRIVQELTLLHRMRGSHAFRRAAETMSALATSYQLSDVQILTFPANGTTFYGTQRSRPAWEAGLLHAETTPMLFCRD